MMPKLINPLSIISLCDFLTERPQTLTPFRFSSPFQPKKYINTQHKLSRALITPKSPLHRVLIDRFDAEQIWQQIDLQSQPLISTLRHDLKPEIMGFDDDGEGSECEEIDRKDDEEREENGSVKVKVKVKGKVIMR
ncbi:hypothetical protein ACFX2I_026157 [Malus domestica]